MNSYKLPENVLFYFYLEEMNEDITIGSNVPDYFVDFGVHIHEIFQKNKIALGTTISNTDPEAVDLHSFTMAVFDIFNAEVTKNGSKSLKRFSKLFPKLVLPLPIATNKSDFNQSK